MVKAAEDKSLWANFLERFSGRSRRRGGRGGAVAALRNPDVRPFIFGLFVASFFNYLGFY